MFESQQVALRSSQEFFNNLMLFNHSFCIYNFGKQNFHKKDFAGIGNHFLKMKKKALEKTL